MEFNKTIQTKYNTKDQQIFFCSDPHFSHGNIMKFCKRPFQTTEEMDEYMVKRWNERVKPKDIVFILGDFCFGGSGRWNDLLDRLNGKKYLILGNHDEKNLRQGYMQRFESVTYQMHIYVDGQSIYLNHYPFLCYAGSYRGEKSEVWQLFGHVHTTPKTKEGRDISRLSALFPLQYDVGFDNNDYMPITFEEVKAKIQYQKTHGEWKRKIIAWVLKLFK